MKKKVYLAADIGAGSGRVLAGIYESGKIRLEEISRFDNQPMDIDGSLHWNMSRIISEIKQGILRAVERYGEEIISIGIDTWGVDYGLIGEDAELIVTPSCYRDQRTDGMVEAANAIMAQRERFEHSGMQLLHFNSLYQLLADKRQDAIRLKKTKALLFIPDIINYWLTGVLANETTVASTSELLDAETGKWCEPLIEGFGFPRSIFQTLLEPGETVGLLRSEVQCELGLQHEIKVVAVPSHDTAAAVAACPLSSTHVAYISSGTWSLMGIESDVPYTSSTANAMSLTNERGVEKTTRLLKNISGFWIFQECKRYWDSEGLSLGYDELRELAVASKPFQVFLDPNDPGFEQPGNMVPRVMQYYKKTGQKVEALPGVICRSVFEGLALSYREVLQGLNSVTGKTIDTLHIIGGGSQNAFLNQLVADATGCNVIAGPVEASGLGNILAQLKASGDIETIRSGREIIQNSFNLENYLPQNTESWEEASKQFATIKERAGVSGESNAR